ncbi:MAG: AAA family ATPase [Deltaproteobacteria bacterium]|nr:MAG: AAA family ATPase [Deltaproteobacteria bacterium]
MYIKRKIESFLQRHLDRGKSIFLLGPRQTGKTTLLSQISADLTISFLSKSLRLRYEKDPDQLTGEIKALPKKKGKTPLVILDEIQKVPEMMDIIQELIDQKVAQFILTGSSARKLKKNNAINLLPGRVVNLRLDPFVFEENPDESLKDRLLYGSLPVIVQEKKQATVIPIFNLMSKLIWKKRFVRKLLSEI